MSNENQETIADIVAKYRMDADAMERHQLPKPTVEHLRILLRRIEDAAKREEKVYLDQIRDAMNMFGHEKYVVEHSQKPIVGNAAAMMAALEMMCSLFDKSVICTSYANTPEEMEQIEELYRKAKAALSEPARNCDIARDWIQDLYCKFKPPATVRREMPPEWVDSVMAFCKWLLAPAPAAGTKGEYDGNK